MNQTEVIFYMIPMNLKKSRQYSIGQMLKDLPGIASQGLGNASRPIIRGLGNSRVKNSTK